MRERFAHGYYKGVTFYYNSTIITVGEYQYESMSYKCHLQNHNKSIYISHYEIESLLNLQRLIKEATQ